jgi:hypothetical protein
MLERLLAEIEAAGSPSTPAELAARIGATRDEVVGLLAALRAHGRLAPPAAAAGEPEGCAIGGVCGRACPGPGGCPLVIELGRDDLQMRS